MLQHKSKKAQRMVDDKHQINVGDGFVRLVNFMGGDATIVQAARVSYGDGTKTLREDLGLLKYLYTHNHMSPFEQVVMTFHIKMPIFVARQMIRHRTARLNEMSARYTPMPNEYWIPDRDQVRKQSTKNKQSSDLVEDWELSSELYDQWVDVIEKAHNLYEKLLEAGVAREQARTILPISLYTQWYWQIDLRNLIHFLKLRLGKDAQSETTDFATAIASYAKQVAPETMKLVLGDS
jgi:thymidylate synthase (FAD)